MVIASIQELTNGHTKKGSFREKPILQAGSSIGTPRTEEGTRLSGVQIGNVGTAGDTLAVYCWASSSALSRGFGESLVSPGTTAHRMS